MKQARLLDWIAELERDQALTQDELTKHRRRVIELERELHANLKEQSKSWVKLARLKP